MSLINEMLRDLESRRLRTFSDVQLQGQGLLVEQPKSRRFVLAGAVLIAVAAVVGIAGGYFYAQLKTVSVAYTLPADPSRPAEDLDPVRTVAAVTAPAPAEQDARQDSVLVSEQPRLTGMDIRESATGTALLLQFAATPTYQIVQTGEGGRPLVLIFDQLRSAPDLIIPELAGLIHQVSMVPQADALKLLVDTDALAALMGIQGEQAADGTYLLSIDFQPETPPSAQQGKVAEKQAMTELVATVVVENLPAVQNAARVTPQGKSAHELGIQQLKENKLLAAESSFTQELLRNPEHVEARLQLFALLVQRSRLDQAEQVVREGLALDGKEYRLRKAYARLLVERQQGQSAIDLLVQRPLPTVAEDLEYFALLAGLLQDRGDYRQASGIYQQLLQVRPQQAIWWMGLGVSLEQSGDRKGAFEAYRQAQRLPGLRSDLQQFVSNRIELMQ